MKLTSIFSLLFLSFIVSLLSFAAFGQRNTNPYKNEQRVLIIDESNVYDDKKDTKRKTLSLKNTTENNFAAFINTIETINNTSIIDELADTNLYSPIQMDTYNEHFDITNGINETIILAPKEDNTLYLIGKLDSMPNGITALLFYAFEGNSIQLSKLVTFDEIGIPIAVQEVQYHIKGSDDGLAQEGKMTCRINSDQTLSCINYEEGLENMIPVYEQVYQVQADGTIQEIALIDLETQFVNNQE